MVALSTRLASRAAEPNLALALGALAALGAEAAHRTQGSTAWVLAGGAASALGLLVAWRNQERLRLPAVLALALLLPVAWLALHLALDVAGDKDSSVVFRWQGNGLLHGDYPRSEYPAGAVALFALEAWLGGGSTRAPNALLMAPLNALVVTCVWLTRARFAPWLAALVGLWPLNSFYWQYKFDLAPAALLLVGLLLAHRGRWTLAGVALGLGAAVKWTPAFAVLALAAWLLSSRRVREAAAHAGAAAAAFALVHAPFVVWAPHETLAAYTRQTGRAITPESLWYLLLRPFDLARVRSHISFGAGAPAWADVGATALQAAAVVLVVVVAARARTRAGAVAAAALAPGAFLIGNRIFSPQFVLVLFAGWAFAAALGLRDRREQLAAGAAMALAAVGNAFVYPYALPYYDVTWPLASLVLFTVAVTLTAVLSVRAAQAR
jgi:hypothetical protein